LVTIRAYLTRFVALATIPILIFAIYLAAERVVGMRLTEDKVASDAARTAAAGLDRQIDAMIDALNVLADSPALNRPEDFPLFYEQAKTFLQYHGSNVVVVDRNGQERISTRVSFGTPLPRASAPVQQVFTTKRPSVSNAFTGAKSGYKLVSVAVPVVRQGEVLYALSLNLDFNRLHELVAQNTFDVGWGLRVEDGNGALLARQPEAPDKPPAQAPSGFAAGQAQKGGQGDAVRQVVVHSAKTPWVVSLDIPRRQYLAPLLRSVVVLGLAGLVVILATVLGSLIVGRRLARAIAALGPDRDLASAPLSGIKEVDDVRLAVLSASRARDAATAAIRRQQELLAKILELLPVGVWILDRAGSITMSNPAGERIWEGSGWGGIERCGEYKGWSRRTGKPIAAEEWPAVRALRRGESSLQEEIDIQCFDGSRKTILNSALPLIGTDGRIEGGLVVHEDITKRIEMEQELRAAWFNAEDANTAKSKFLAAASHDLRQPVQSLMLLSSALAGKLRGHPAAQVLAHMEKATTALKDMLDGLLDISRLDAGIVEIDIQDVSIRSLIEHLASEYRLRAAERNLTFHVVAPDWWCRSDPRLLERLLRNLIENALKYTPQGKILLGCRHRGRDLAIIVGDTGIGIPADQLEPIFREFHQLDNPERDRSKGLGLGLAIVRRLATLLGHDVRVRSRPSQGSCFTLLVQGAVRPSSVKKAVCPPLRPPAGDLILVVEDEADVRLALEIQLGEWGYEVVSGPDDQAVLERLAPGKMPKAILADYQLRGGQTGVEVVRRLDEKLGCVVPVAIITGDTASEHLAETRAAGFRLMHKPVSAPALLRCLQELVGNSQRPAAGSPVGVED
jgi:two-component system, sensor histidine kinase